MDSLPRRTAALSAAYKTVTLNQFNNNKNNINGSGFNSMTDSASTVSNSAEDLTLLDKSLRNSMLQDVVHFKKQLVRLRRILQEVCGVLFVFVCDLKKTIFVHFLVVKHTPQMMHELRCNVYNYLSIIVIIIIYYVLKEAHRVNNTIYLFISI